ncbi:hypothetical protein N7470_008380 [Penicillium chermesinum]|nr:hypothetical protein N7470_008380 [Penicillium chermesinum]
MASVERRRSLPIKRKMERQELKLHRKGLGTEVGHIGFKFIPLWVIHAWDPKNPTSKIGAYEWQLGLEILILVQIKPSEMRLPGPPEQSSGEWKLSEATSQIPTWPLLEQQCT